MLNLPRFKAAAVQAAPAFLDPVATVDKAASLIREAAANGAALVAFPEVFVAGYPYWSWIVDPVAGSAWFEKLVRASIMVPGPEVDQLCTVAREAGVHVVIGVNERSPVALGTLYNTMLFIGPDGGILGKHRKLVPTWAGKLAWAHGDGARPTPEAVPHDGTPARPVRAPPRADGRARPAAPHRHARDRPALRPASAG